MGSQLLIPAILLLLSWLVPVTLLLLIGYSASTNIGSRHGSGWTITGGVLISLSSLLYMWYITKFGHSVEIVRHSYYGILIIAALAVFTGGARLLEKLEKRWPDHFHLHPRKLRWMMYGMMIMGVTLATIVYSLLYGVSAPRFMNYLLFNVSSSFLACLYAAFAFVIYGFYSKSIRRYSFIPCIGLLFILGDAFFRTYSIETEMSLSQIMIGRMILNGGIAVAAIALVVVIGHVLKMLGSTMLQNPFETPVQRSKKLVQCRMLVAILITVLATTASGVLILESVRTNEENIEETYLTQQQNVAENVAANLRSLLGSMIETLSGMAQKPSVQMIKKDSLRQEFKSGLERWGRSISAFSRVDELGVLQYTYPENPSVVGMNLRSQNHVRRFLETRDTTMSTIFETVQGYRAIAIYQPVYRIAMVRDGLKRKEFAGGVAMLVRLDAFSIRAFRNVAYLNPNPIAVINGQQQIIGLSDSTSEVEYAIDYLQSVFGFQVSVDTLKSVMKILDTLSKPRSIPIREEPYEISPRWIVGIPLSLGSMHAGTIIVPIRKAEIVSLYKVGTKAQLILWGVFLGIICSLMGTLLLIIYRWSSFLEAEVERDLEVIRQTEGKYKNLVNEAVVGIFQADGEGRITVANPTLCRMLGHGSLVEFIDHEVSNASAGGGIHRRSLADILRKGVHPGEAVELVKRDGTVMYARFHVKRIVDEKDRIIRYEGFVEDVTEQRHTEELRKDLEKRYYELFALSPAGIFISTIDGRIIEANESAARIYGFESVEEMKKMPAQSFYPHPADRQKIIDDIQQHGSMIQRIVEGRRRDGSTVYALNSASIEYDPVVGTQVFRGVELDITDLIELQQTVQTHRLVTEAVNETLVAALQEIDLQSFIIRIIRSLGTKLHTDRIFVSDIGQDQMVHDVAVWTSPGAEAILHDLVQVSYLENSLSHLGGADEHLYVWQANDAEESIPEYITQRGVKSLVIVRIVIEDRTWGFLGFEQVQQKRVWSVLERSMFRSIGQIVASVVSRTLESSARQRLEEDQRKLFSALDQLVESFIITDVESRIEYVNKGFTTMTGFQRDDVVGKPLVVVAGAESSTILSGETWTTLQSGRVFRGRVRSRRKDGSEFMEDLTVAPVVDNHGNIRQFVAVGYDATSQVFLEEQLAQAQKMESIGLLAGGIAHDFNNLLGGILGYASFIKTKLPKDDGMYRYVDTIERSASRAAELTAQLLAFARGGKYSVAPVNVNTIINETLRIIARTFDKSIEVITFLAGSLPPVEADASQLQQVIMNLCVNARDAMPSGGQLIIESNNVTMSKEYSELHLNTKPGSYVMISVTDTGTGMDTTTIKKIFDPFFTTKEKGKGTGLGLSMVYGIVQNHNGFVRVYSEVGQGSTFHVYFPASEQTEQPLATETAILSGGNECVLIVDDEPAICNLVKDTLESVGYKVLIAEDGEQAIEIYTAHKKSVDLVILDMVMPKLGGRETYQRLKQINPDVKVLLSTGFSQTGKAKEIMDDGALGFLQKPYQIHELLHKVRAVLNVPHAGSEKEHGE